MNYYDILLAKKLEDDRDPKVEGLSVTANGTYSEEGKVYKPVVVNVAGYSLEEMPSGAISSFNDGAALPLNNLKISIDPVQSGSGDPSPTNIRPILGWNELNVTVADDVDNPTVENLYTIDLDGTRYGGTLDVVSGVLTANKVYVVYDGSADENWFKYGSGSASAFAMCSNNALLSNINAIPMASYLKGISRNETWGNYDEWVSVTSGDRLVTGIQSITEVEDWKSYLSSNNLQVVYELATPQAIQLTPTMVKSLNGVNNVYADTGNIIEGQYFKSL